MKKAIVISALIATACLSSTASYAEASKEENVGFASGALTGAAVGGPVGFIVGAVAGVLIGEQVEKANQLDEVEAQLAKAEMNKSNIEKELAMIQETMEYNQVASEKADWLTEGLTTNVMFTTNSFTLSDADLATIKKLSSVLKEFPSLNIRLDGYSDPRGKSEHNLALSEKRATSVKNAFEKFGISADRVALTAHGELDGLGQEGNLDAYAMARKVSVNFTSQTVDRVAQN